MSVRILTEPGQRRFQAEAGETLLAAALRQGIGLPYGCRNGTCGTCAAAVLAGAVEQAGRRIEALAGGPAGTCLACQAVPVSDLVLGVREADGAAEIVARILPCRVVRKEPLSHDVMRLHLKVPEQQPLQRLAGQYLEFILPDGRRRAFSIANAPQDDASLELHVRQVPGGAFTDYVFGSLKEKTILRIEAPLGTFFLRESSPRPLIMVAGGTGFAPLKAMIEHAFQVGIERPLHLYWGVRARRDLYLPSLPAVWMDAHPNVSFVPVLSQPDPDWYGRRGLVHEAVIADWPDLSPFDVYMSGPPPMVEAGRLAFAAHGLPSEQLYCDAFAYAADARTGQGGGEVARSPIPTGPS